MNHRASAEEPSAESHLFSYLRMVETNGEGLPAPFVEALRRTLAHYGVRELDGSAELKESLLWICKSHQRMEQQTAFVIDILERRLHRAKASPPSNNFRILLDRMIPITHEPYPSVSDLAREVRYRCFDQPIFERARDQVYQEAETILIISRRIPTLPTIVPVCVHLSNVRSCWLACLPDDSPLPILACAAPCWRFSLGGTTAFARC